MKEVGELLKLALIKLMERESFVDVLEYLGLFLLMLAATRLALWLVGLDAFIKDAGFYFITTFGAIVLIRLVCGMVGWRYDIPIKVLLTMALVGGIVYNIYCFLTGTYVPILK